MSRSPEDYLQHVLDEADYLLEHSRNLKKDDFLQDETLKRSFVRSLEIIGEATKNLPASFKAEHSQVSWRSMAGMRDKLIHNYFGVDYEIVWDAVIHEIPDLKVKISQIMDQTRNN